MFKKLMAVTLGLSLCSSQAFAAAAVQVQIDSKPLKTDVTPVVENGRVMVPFRAIFEALGLQVDWNDTMHTATAYNDTTNVAIKLDAGYGAVNGELKPLDVHAYTVNGRTLVPLRFVSEAFGNQVKWDDKKKLVSITSGFKPYAYTDNLPVVGSLDKLQLILDYAGRYQRQPVYYAMDMMKAAAPVAAESSTAGTSNAVSHSETNVQVQGVDEADVVKTDGQYIYQMRSNDLKIVKASNGQMSEISTLKFEQGFTPQEFYLYGSKLVLIGSLQSYESGSPGPMYRTIMPMYTSKTQIRFYDISDPASAKLVRRYETTGSYLTSRVTQGQLYLVANQSMNRYDTMSESMLPEYYDSALNQKGRDACSNIRYFPDAIDSNFMITMGFDLNQLTQAPDRSVYLGSGNQVYASTDSLYVATNRYQYTVRPDSLVPVFRENTDLFRFALSSHSIKFQSKGTVPGSLINQFSMDDSNGYFRVATTTGNTWNTGSDTSKNNVYVLDHSLKTVGKLEGLAPSEKIYSTRFMGDRLYMVTYKQVDPFYVIDLKNPQNPSVLGYLKIPGFSEYLHPYDANTVIGFGKETVDKGDRTIPEGMKIGLFDVSDVSHPVEKSRMVIGGQGTYSELLDNHKALMFLKDRGVMAFPVSVYQTVKDQNQLTFQGGYVLSVDPQKGLALKGTTTHLSASEIANAATQWYDNTKNVQRIIEIGDWIYSLSEYGIKSNELNSMKETAFFTYTK